VAEGQYRRSGIDAAATASRGGGVFGVRRNALECCFYGCENIFDLCDLGLYNRGKGAYLTTSGFEFWRLFAQAKWATKFSSFFLGVLSHA
jgi:hypothetical protein